MQSVVATAPRAVQADTRPEVVIEIRNLSKVYRDFWGRQKVRALKALDLEIRRGEMESEVRLGDERGFTAEAIVVGIGATLNDELAQEAG
ncbi:MAG: hypothetical protein WD403_07535, partial [Pirellulales bacterium]